MIAILLPLLRSGTFWRVAGALALAAAIGGAYGWWEHKQRDIGRADQLSKDAKKLVEAQAKIDGLEVELGKREAALKVANDSTASCVKAQEEQALAILAVSNQRAALEKQAHELAAKHRADSAIREAEIASLRAFAAAPPKPQACEATLKATDDILRSVRRK